MNLTNWQDDNMVPIGDIVVHVVQTTPKPVGYIIRVLEAEIPGKRMKGLHRL